MDHPVFGIFFDFFAIVDGFSKYVEQTSKGLLSNRYFNSRTGSGYFHIFAQSVTGSQHDTTCNIISDVLRYFHDTAFSAIVNSLVKDLINPLLGFLVGKPDFTGLFIVLSEPAGYTGPRTYEALTAAGATVFGYGAFLTAVVHFLLLAFVIFWLIKVVTGLRVRLEALAKADKEKAEEEAAAKPQVTPEDIALLREIRDLLKEASAKKS